MITLKKSKKSMVLRYKVITLKNIRKPMVFYNLEKYKKTNGFLDIFQGKNLEKHNKTNVFLIFLQGENIENHKKTNGFAI